MVHNACDGDPSVVVTGLDDLDGLAFDTVDEPCSVSMRRDQQPASWFSSGSGFPIPLNGDRRMSSISTLMRRTIRRSAFCLGTGGHVAEPLQG